MRAAAAAAALIAVLAISVPTAALGKGGDGHNRNFYSPRHGLVDRGRVNSMDWTYTGRGSFFNSCEVRDLNFDGRFCD